MELRKVLAQAEASRARSDNVNHALYKAQVQLRQVRIEVTDLILDVAAYLRYVLRSKPKSKPPLYNSGAEPHWTQN